jgi:hypothetical protein
MHTGATDDILIVSDRKITDIIRPIHPVRPGQD